MPIKWLKLWKLKGKERIPTVLFCFKRVVRKFLFACNKSSFYVSAVMALLIGLFQLWPGSYLQQSHRSHHQREHRLLNIQLTLDLHYNPTISRFINYVIALIQNYCYYKNQLTTFLISLFILYIYGTVFRVFNLN